MVILRPTTGERWSSVGGELVLAWEAVRLPSNHCLASPVKYLKYSILIES